MVAGGLVGAAVVVVCGHRWRGGWWLGGSCGKLRAEGGRSVGFTELNCQEVMRGGCVMMDARRKMRQVNKKVVEVVDDHYQTDVMAAERAVLIVRFKARALNETRSR